MEIEKSGVTISEALRIVSHAYFMQNRAFTKINKALVQELGPDRVRQLLSSALEGSVSRSRLNEQMALNLQNSYVEVRQIGPNPTAAQICDDIEKLLQIGEFRGNWEQFSGDTEPDSA